MATTTARVFTVSSSRMTPRDKARLVHDLARAVGFDLIGIAPAVPSQRAEHYRDWLAAGHAGTMRYLHENVPVRADPRHLLPGARAIICAAMNYRRADGYVGSHPAPAPSDPLRSEDSEAGGRVAQYARGADYHTVLHRLLGTLEQRLRAALSEPFAARVVVDTQPLFEREVAARAGLGWIGRNTCLLHPEWGSYLVLGELLTTLELAADEPLTERCGTCRRCLEACPTQAFEGPYKLNATRCLSYWTIEERGPIPVEFHAALGDRVLGCDVCQQVCPYNARAPLAVHPELGRDVLGPQLNLVDLVALRSAGYRKLVRGTAGRRATGSMWQRNAALVLGNKGKLSSRERAALEQLAATGKPPARAAAQSVLAIYAGNPTS